MTLAEFTVERVEVDSPDGTTSMLAVTCPRSGCRGEFWVTHKWTYLATVLGANNQMVVVYGRNCPYCSRAARIPAEFARQRPKVKRSKSR